MLDHRATVLRVRINQIDHTLSQPGLLDNSTLSLAPVIRIYGTSSTGVKTCVHVHQVYPYFFIEYTGKLTPSIVKRYITRLKSAINHGMAVSMRRNPHSPKSQFVRAIVLVKGVPFYGFHTSYSPFLKIHMVDPTLVNRASTILQSGSVMQTKFRVFETHLSYLLQFMCDFGLYGCGWIELGQVWDRGSSRTDVDGTDQEIYGERTLEADENNSPSFERSPYFRQSRMALEVDVPAHQILNRHLLTARNIHHKLEIPAPSLPPEPLILSVRELWEDERNRRRAKGLSPSPEIPVDPSESRRKGGGEWVAEARWWEAFRKKLETEDRPSVKMDHSGWEKWVMTTFESIESLWETRWKTWVPFRGEDGENVQNRSDNEEKAEDPFNPESAIDPAGATEALDDVDESMLSSQEMSQLAEQEELAWARLHGSHLPEDQIDDDIFNEDFPPDDDGAPHSQRGELGGSQHSLSDPFVESLITERANHSQDTRFAPSTPPPNDSNTLDAKPTPTRKRKNPVASVLAAGPAKRKRATANVPQWRQEVKSEMISSEAEPTQNETFSEVASQNLLGVSERAIANQPYPEPADHYISFRHYDHEILTKGPSSVFDSGSCEAEEPEPSEEQDPESTSRNTLLLALESSSLLVSPTKKSLNKMSTLSSGLLAMQTSDLISALKAPDIKANGYSYAPRPPSMSELLSSTDECGIPSKIYRDPYYAKEADVPEKPREYAGLLYHLKGDDGLRNLEEWVGVDDNLAFTQAPNIFASNSNFTFFGGWEYSRSPPNPKLIRLWLGSDEANLKKAARPSKGQSQIEGPTQANEYGLKTSPDAFSDVVTRAQQDMTAFSLEVFALSRGDRVPDADVDEIASVFYAFQESQIEGMPQGSNGVVVVERKNVNPQRLRNINMEMVPSELELINRIVDIIVDLDPDILAGWEVQTSSWGYLNARAQFYGFDVGDLISRAPSRFTGGEGDQWGLRKTSTFKVVGRHVLNMWRIVRSELTLNIYTFENVAFHLLRQRVPRFSPETLTDWYNNRAPEGAVRVLQYFARRNVMVLEILERAEIVTKTAEFARVFGVDFFSVISRGSQFKVESVMFRIAKPESFVLLSPSKQDVGKQNAAECIPLIMEPLSAFYNSPLVVLDFQSLYPSVMIAYNYCYSTCLGRIADFRGQNKFGVTDLEQDLELLDLLKDQIRIAPNGIMYVKQEVRKGLLGRMLSELLETRVMVKQAMKGIKGDREKALRRILDARQLSLKFICNVTYGYTSASYSGRMPAVEIADSIVQTGRETLEKAVRVIDDHKKWGGKVVYGDTDSLFVYLRGKTKEQAFRIGHDIADTITALNPAPMKLKFEKVYLPCVLMAKKRYVGFKYENPDDKDPVFDAKGIETVRRDGIPAQQKMTENCLKILFRTQNLTEVKEYCWRSWMRILDGKASIQDFIFAKEVRLGTYSDKVPPPPGVTVAARRTIEDPSNEPQYGERIPYVIIRGEKSRLVDRAIAPQELLNDRHKHIDGAYYVSRVLIPPLERIFNLVGADVRSWYEEMPKSVRAQESDPLSLSPQKVGHIDAEAADARIQIDEHFQCSQCLICGSLASEAVCGSCRLRPEIAISGLQSRIKKDSPPADPIRCESLDCPWLFERKRAEHQAEFLVLLQRWTQDIADLSTVEINLGDTSESDSSS